ncbi:MAG: beta-ketoacyl-ACP synthase [Fibromonadaceae bacterium]|jgi:3-oxoacyl-[acyl-carrier-protein] synthase II|nr:beta-ketoacyl-ACP synthase [Fibromonadaceae bacterium]
MSKRVVVTGGSCVSALGQNWSEILTNLKSKKNCVVRMEQYEKYAQMNTKLAAPVNFTPPDYPRQKTRGMGRVALMATYCTDCAIKNAGLSGNAILRNGRCGVAYGSSMGNVDALLDFFSMLTSDRCDGITATTYIRSMPQTCAVNIGVFFELTGRIITTNTACTSGSMSIGYAYETIKNGQQDIMIAGGADELSPTSSAVFDTLFATSTKNETPHLTPRAFDKERDGLVVGEGAGTLILEEYEHAIARSAKIYAEIAGFGTNTDGFHITQPNRDTMQIALELAIKDADISPDKIDYVNAHGTATDKGDIAESHATYNALKKSTPVSTLKNYIGHTLGACGAIEAWLSIMMMREGWFAPNINSDDIDAECANLDYIQGEGREINAKYIMSNNFAFGGINTSLIFKNWDSK